jgi:hypothetical protein
MKYKTRWATGIPLATVAAVLFVQGAFAANDKAGSSDPAASDKGTTWARGAIAAAVERGKMHAHPPAEDLLPAGLAGWQTVYDTLQHPRCMNCHPAEDRPLQTDKSLPHAMNITRQSPALGLECATCHGTQNSEAYGILGGPPGAPHWQLPDADMPLIFEGRSSRELCEQLKRPRDNGFKTLAAMRHHIAEDALVLWGWNPGGGRSTPPVPHDDFVAAFDAWLAAGAVCP